jgi:hypothetical protein
MFILDKDKAKGEVGYADLEVFHTFKWLLNGGQMH